MERPTILVVDDDQTFLDSVSFALKSTTEVLSASTVRQGEETLRRTKVDAIVADYRMDAGHDGHEFLAIAQELKPSPPVILVTAYATKQLAIESLNRHCFAFLEKPVSFPDLSQAITDAVERTKTSDNHFSSSCLGKTASPDISLDADLCSICFDGKRVHLTKVEFRILKLLLQSSGRRIERDEIMKQVWGRSRTSHNLLDTHLRNMRRKLPFLSRRLKSVWGMGYIFIQSEDDS